MEVGLLGPVTVPVPAGEAAPGKRARALLAVLALAQGDPVPDAELATRVWGTALPPDPATALDGLLAQLATVLPQDAIARTADGTGLAPGTVTTDVERFAALVVESEAAGAAGDLDRAHDRLEQALDLWRGEPLADVSGTPYLDAGARSLAEARLAAIEARCDLGLRQGRHAELVDEVRGLLARHPTRERLWGVLMTALDQSGRREEAVTAYAEARATLADELGTEPGEALQELQARIPRHDPQLGGAGEVSREQPRPRARVPVLSSSTFGRDGLVAEVAELLTDPAVRLVTLTGIGGSGKSRIATLVAAAVQESFTDVAYLQVTEASQGRQLAVEIALALDCPATDDLAVSLAGLADDHRALVVLDNLEALADGAALVRRLLAAAGQITVLVTSRLPLRVDGEHELPVNALDVPTEAAGTATMTAAASVRLFVDRATSAAPTFRLAGHERDVAEICGLLDGLPLAIELAAAWVKVLRLDRIIDGLRTNLDLLATGAEGVPERQRAMATAIRWSYDRLSPEARLVCDRLVLFERGFTTEAVEAVCPDIPDVIAALRSIVDARLVRELESRADERHAVLGTVRAFARERLESRSDLTHSRELLAAHLTARAEEARASVYGPDGHLTLARFDDDAADISRAVRWALGAGRRGTAVELLLASLDCWVASGRHAEALVMTLEVLDHVPQQGPDAAGLLAAASQLAHQLSDHEQSREHGRLALELAERHGDRASAARARAFLAAALVHSGAVDEGVALAEAAAAEAKALDLYPLARQALSVLAMAMVVAGDSDGERRAHQALLAVVRAKGDLDGTADTLNTLAEIALDDADAETADMFATEALAISAQRLPPVTRDATITLARVALVRSDLAEAARQLGLALDLSDRLGQSLAVAQCLRVGGCLAAARGNAGAAVRLFAAGHTLAPPPGGGEVPFEHDLAAGLAESRAVLGEEASGRAWLLGAGLPLETIRAQLTALLDEVSSPG